MDYSLIWIHTNLRPNLSLHRLQPPLPPPSPSFRGCCLFLLFSFLALVVVLALKLKKPEFDLQQVGVQSLGIIPSSASSAAVSLVILMVLSAANDNKVGIKYGESRFTVMYRGIPLGRSSILGFYQPAHSVRSVETIIVVDWVRVCYRPTLRIWLETHR